MSATEVYKALNKSIVNGVIDLFQAAIDETALNALVPVLELFGITGSWSLTLGNLSEAPTTVLLTGSGDFSQPGATAAKNIYAVSATLNYRENGNSFDLSFQITAAKVWTFSDFFLTLPQTNRADVANNSSGGITWFDSYLIDVVINSPVFAAKTGDTELTLTGFLPKFQDSNISDRLTLLSPWPLRLEGTLSMPADAIDFPIMTLKAQGNLSNLFFAGNDGDVSGPAPINVNELSAALIIDTLDPELWGVDAYSTLRMYGSFDLGGGLSGSISNLTLSNGKTWSFSVQFDPETASLTQGLLSLANIFGVPLPIPMDFPLLTDFSFSGVDIDFSNSASSNATPLLSLSGLALTVVSNKTWTPPVPFVTFTDVGARWVWGWTIINNPKTNISENRYLVTGSVFASVVFDDGGETLEALPPGPITPATEGLPALAQADSSNDVTIDVSLSLPSLYINGAMQEGDYIGIGKAFNKYFGGVCPVVPSNMNITELNFFADPIEQVYSGSATILFGTPDAPQPDQAWTIFSIDTVGITLQSLEMEVRAQGGKVGGGITGVFYLEGAGANSYEDPQITVSAAYPPQNTDDTTGWFFAGALYPGTSIDLTNMVARFIMGDPDYPVPDYIPVLAVDTLSATFESASGAYTFAGSMSVRWNPTIFGTELMVSASAATAISRASAQTPIIGQLMGSFSVNKIAIAAAMDIGLREPTYLFKVQFDELWIQAVTAWRGTTQATRHQVVSIQLGGITLGEILEYLVNLAAPTIGFKLDPPWDILNRIDLSRFVLTIDPTDNVVEFVYTANVNLGVMRIDTVGARYTKGAGEGKVELILTGNFLGQSYPEDAPLSWDVVNDAPPDVAGQGASLVDLRFIGFGQRITFAGQTPDTVAESVALLVDAMQTPEPGNNPLANPGIVYSDQSQWLIGVDISLMEMLDLSIIFNDPKLYGLSIGLKGEKAGPLAGLKFEILYKKITDDIGMFRVELRVPDAFRTIQLGAVSLTLGIIVVEIYTNGNFKIDLGFPYNRDFSRSFTIQAGIFIGRGGFYFGVLDSDTSTRVPTITNGNFSPVIELGVGLAAGVGREIKAGILSGGAYIEIEVIFQGVLAWFNPTSNGAAPANYFWAQGVIAIHGKVYGAVDFKVVKVSVTLEVWAQASVTFESCKPLLLDFTCGVRAEASVKILFVRIHFHFSVTLELSFTIGDTSPTPWILASDQQTTASTTQLYTNSATQDHQLRGLQLQVSHLSRINAMDGALRTSGELMVWDPSTLVFTSKQTAHLTMLPLFSIKEVPVDWTGETPTNPAPVYRASFLLYADTGIDTSATTTAHTANRSAALSATANSDAGTSGLAADLLTEGLLLYTLYALSGGPTTTSDPVTAGQLALIAEQLSLPQTSENGFSYAILSTFFTTNIAFIVTGVPSGTAPAEKSAMVFPIPPCFSWDSPQWGSTDFATNNMIGPLYQQQIDQILNQYLGAGSTSASVTTTDESFSQFIFRDFCQMLVKAAIDEAQQQLQDVSITFNSTLSQTAQSFTTAEVSPVKATGDTVASVAQRVGATTQELVFLNDDVQTTIANTPTGETMTLAIGVDPQTLALDNSTVKFSAQVLPLGTIIKAVAQSINSFTEVAAPLNVTDITTILAFEPESEYTVGENPNLLLEDSAFSLVDPRIFIPPANGGFDLTRAAALFFVRYDNPDLAPQGTIDIPAWYSQTISLMNIDTLREASAAGTIPQSVEIKPGTSLIIPLQYLDHKPNPVNYCTVPGDTLYRIGTMLTLAQDDASAYVPPLWESFKNEVSASGNNFIIPAWVIDPTINNSGVIIEHGENVQSLARRLVINATFDGVDPVAPSKWLWSYDWSAIALWIGTAQILSPQGEVSVPNATTSSTQIFSFESLSETYGLSIADAATRLQDVSNLYADGTALTVKQIPVQTVEKIVTGILASTAFAGVVNQASRMMMAGLNLPNPITDSNANVLGNPDDPQPLYDLTGQQKDVTVGDTATDIALNLTVASSEQWITFSDSHTVSTSDTFNGLLATHSSLLSLNPGIQSDKALHPGMIVATGTTASGTLTFNFTNADVTADLATGLAIAPSPATPPSPLSMTLKGYSPRTYGFEQRIVLQSPIALQIPDSTAISGNPSLWPFPQSFLKKAITDTSTAYEIYSTLLGATQGSDSAEVDAVTFGTYIPFRILKVDDGTNRFALLGVDTDQRALLLELKTWLDADSQAAQTQAVLAIPPAPNASNAQGVVILDPAKGSTYLIKTNLSTDSVPPDQLTETLTMTSTQSASEYYADFTTDFSDFLQLLWEGSTVGGTGYYFGSGTPLPGSAFDERGIAILNLLVIPGSQQSLPSASGRALLKFNTCLLVGTGVDSSINTLYAQAGDNTDVTPLCLVPPGNSGFTLVVDRRLTANPPIPDDERNLEERYNLLAFSSAAASGSPYEIDEAWTPALPVPDDGSTLALWEKERLLRKAGKSLSLLADEASPCWRHDQVIPFYNFTVDPAALQTSGLPDPAQDPYRGFADLNTAPSPLLTFRFSDLLGNRSAAPEVGQGALNLTVGYTDPLIGIGDWPSVSASFEVLLSEVPNAVLKVNLSLKGAALLPTPSQRGDVNLEATNRQKEKYGQVYYQLTQNGMAAALSTTLRWIPDPLNQINQGQTIDINPLWRFAGGAFAHAHTTALLTPTIPLQDTAIADITTTYNVRYTEIAEANKNQLVSTLFVSSTTALQIPAYLPYVAERSLDLLYETRPAGWPDPGSGSALFCLAGNATLLLKTDTILTLPTAQVRSIATGTTTATPSLATLAANNYVTSEILAEQNADTTGLLAPSFVFTIVLEEANESTLSVTVTVVSTALDSFTAVQLAFADQGVNLSIGQIAAFNADLTGMLAPNKTLECALYVVQEGDTPEANNSGCTVSELGNVNGGTAAVFDDGSLVCFGTLNAAVDGTLEALGSQYACTGESILEANATVKVGQNIAVPGSVSWPADAAVLSQMRVPFTVFSATDLFADIVTRFSAFDGSAGTATVNQTVEENRQINGTLAAQITIVVSVDGTDVTIVTGNDDSFDCALEKAKVQNPAATLDDLADAIANETGVLALGALLLFAPALLETAATPSEIQDIYGITTVDFALANNATAQLIPSGVQLTCRDTTSTNYSVTTKTGETFNSLIVAFALEGITVDAGIIATQNNTATLYAQNAKALLPPASLEPTVSLGTGGPYMASIFPLSSTLTFVRPNALVNPEFQTATQDSAVERADTIIAPLTTKSMGVDTDPGLTYLRFIEALDSALPNLRAGTAKTQESTSDLWCVDFSTTGITEAALIPGTVWAETNYPRFFALAPLYSQLVTRNSVTLYPLDDNGELSDTGNEINFQAVDVEPLAQAFLVDFDRFLNVYYSSALYDYDNGSLRSTLNSAIASKQNIIASIADGLNYVLEVDSDPGREEGQINARESFQQQLGINLSKGYETSVAIQYDLTVDSPWTRGTTALPASLYGDASCNNANFAVSIVSAKTPLEKASGAVTFFATVSDPTHVRALRGELDYAYSNIEFNISTLGVPEGYTSSDWLAFIPLLDEAAKPPALAATNPGAFDAPIPLRTFPPLPTIKSQTSAPTVLKPTSLDELSQWSFAFSYTHQHAAQDTVYINADFNLSAPTLISMAAVDPKDLFTELTQYASVSDKLWTLLEPLLRDEPTSDTVKNAAQTFASLVASIEQYWPIRLASDSQAGTADDNYIALQSYSFTARVQYNEDKTIASYSLTKVTEPGPSGLWPQVEAFDAAGIPVLLEAGDPLDGKVVYDVPDGKVIPATDSPTLRITWTAINVSSYQNARARIWVERNQYLLEDSDSAISLMIPTNPAFLFKTSVITATGIVTPLLQWTDRQEITADSLTLALVDALDTLFPTAARLQDTTATFGVFYTYELAGDSALPNQSLVGKTPVTLYPNQGLEDSVAQQIQNAVDTWFNTVHPSSSGGEWSIGFTLYSALETAQRPIFTAELFYRIN